MEKENTDAKRQEQELIHNAKIKARDILLEAKEDAAEMIKQINASTSRQNLENARNHLNNKIKKIHLLDSLTTNSSNDLKNTLDAKNIIPNMEVYVSKWHCTFSCF